MFASSKAANWLWTLEALNRADYILEIGRLIFCFALRKSIFKFVLPRTAYYAPSL